MPAQDSPVSSSGMRADGGRLQLSWFLRHYMFFVCIFLHCLLIAVFLALGILGLHGKPIIKHDSRKADEAVFIYNSGILPNIIFKV